MSSRVIDARSKERPLSSTSQPANVDNGIPVAANARTVITSFDTYKMGNRQQRTRSNYVRLLLQGRKNLADVAAFPKIQIKGPLSE